MNTCIKLNNKLVCLAHAIVGCEGNKQLEPATYLRRLFWFPQETMLIVEIHVVWHAGKHQTVSTEYRIVDDKDLDFAVIALEWLPVALREEVYEKCFAGRLHE